MLEYRALIAVLVVQVGILVAIPAKKLKARAVGQQIILKTAPVDPYDILSGYYVVLGYEVERPKPHQIRDDLEPGQVVYLNVTEQSPAWTLVSVTASPEAQGSGEASIRARWDGRRARILGGERLFIPEDQRGDIARAMADHDSFVDMKVDGSGEAAVLRLRAGDQVFGEQ